MATRDYDVVIVGARCAGATLAILTARAGARVLLLDKDPLPSDVILSTHFVAAPGVDVLDEVGVGTAMRAVTPASRVIRFSADHDTANIPLPKGREVYCPRRERLDGLLQKAAVDAGATLGDRTRVTALVREGDRVVGVRTLAGGKERLITARLVVGADGRHSSVARMVGAEEYFGYDARRAGFWAYWDAPPSWRNDPARPFDCYFSLFGDETALMFPTDHDQLIIGSWPPVHRTTEWRADPERTLRRVLASEPLIGPLIGDSAPLTQVRGVVKERFYFRRAAGSGWVLVGDAGHHKDYVIGDGITEALLQARSLATAIAEGSDAALTRWWRARDIAALPVYFMGKEAGAPVPLPAANRAVLSSINADRALLQAVLDVMDRRRTPFDPMLGLRAGRHVLAAVPRRPGVIGEMLAMSLRALPFYARWLAMRARFRTARVG